MARTNLSRRIFLGQCATASTAMIVSPWSASLAADDIEKRRAEWLAMRKDPVREMFPGTPDLDRILGLFPRTTGKPAFDPQEIAENIARLKTTPSIDTGHSFLDLSVKTALAHIDATFQGDHPKYGVGFYGKARHDGFVPTIIAAVDWPELLSSGLLPGKLANRLVDSRLSAGGQFCGMTRFADMLDDWPLADYLYGLWSLGRKNDFRLSLYGHVAYHQAEEHLTAYEAVTFPPGKLRADYSMPCQLVAARAGRLLVPGH